MLGRKRFLLVDTEGWVIAQYVDAADVADSDSGRLVVRAAQRAHPRLHHLWVDAGFAGEFVDWVRQAVGWTAEVVTKVAGQVGFQVQAHRWLVERTYGWLGRQRRLSKDYEELEESTEAWIYLAMIGLMARRITHLTK